MACPEGDRCTTRTPIVALSAVQSYLDTQSGEQRNALTYVSRLWAEDNSKPLAKMGIVGRSYTVEERVAIAADTPAIHETRCPFAMENNGCMVNRLPKYNPKQKRSTPEYMFLPGAILRVQDRASLRHAVEKYEVADAKVAFLTRSAGLGISGNE